MFSGRSGAESKAAPMSPDALRRFANGIDEIAVLLIDVATGIRAVSCVAVGG
jgi:hypothetical protein